MHADATSDRTTGIGGLIARIRHLPAALGLVILVRVLLIATYPLNYLRSDGLDYFKMLVGGTSNLILAAGYPFLLGLPFRNPLGRWLIEDHRPVFETVLLILQHSINIICIYLAYRVVDAIWGRLPATLFVLLYGLHPQTLTVTSSMSPEWLQSSLIMLVAYLVFRALGTSDLRHKTLIWACLGSVFCWAFLVKYNSLFLIWLPATAALIELRRSRRAFLAPLVGVVAAALTWAVFVVAFHRPSTGTTTLTMDKACILLQRVELMTGRHSMSPDTGVDTKRLLVLNALLPAPDHYRRPIPHVDWVNDTTREPFRRRYSHLLDADDRTLSTYAEDLDLARPFNFGRAYLPIAYHLDLEEANSLGVRVFFEHVRANPGAYVRSVLELTRKTLLEPKLFWSYPVDLSRMGRKAVGWGYVEIKVDPNIKPTYRFTRDIVWLPGVVFFKLLAQVFSWPPIWVTLLILIGLTASIIDIQRSKKLDPGPFWYVVCALGTLAFVVASNTMYHFRWKEVPVILPVLCMLTSVSITFLLRWTARFDQRYSQPDASPHD